MEKKSHQKDAPSRLIVADDLSSAVDCAVRMLPWMSDAFIPLSSDPPQEWGGDSILSVFTDSRESAPPAAYAAVRRAMAWIPIDERTVAYKSIDSTLRGNLGSELDAMLDTGHFDGAVVAPAFPHYGRTTINGRQLLFGKPLEETEFASDPTCPVDSSSVARRFAEQSTRDILEIGLGMVRGPTGLLAMSMEDGFRSAPVLVCDAETEFDLDHIENAIALVSSRVLRVGSTGWARAVAARETCERGAPSEIGCPARAVLVVSGSASETTAEQLAELGKEGAAIAKVPLDELMTGSEERTINHWQSKIESLFARGGRLVVLTTECRRSDVLRATKIGTDHGWTPHRVAGHLASRLARISANLLERLPGLGIVATGGETTRAVFASAGVRSISLLSEVEPGIPLGVARARAEFPVVIKAGGFGSPRVLITAAKALLDAR